MNTTLSVVTICFNNLPDLIETCQSIEKQSMPPTSHIIIDGSTNDDILNWLTKNKQPEYRRWIHERDKGISDAFNKGITHSTDDVIHLLNSGDKYHLNDAIETVLSYFKSDPQLMWTHSLYVQHRADSDIICGVPFESKLLWKGMRTIGHPTMFVKKSLYDRYGLFDINYKLAMDFDFLLRIRNEKFAHIQKPLIYFSPGGVSSIQFKQALKEVKQSYKKHIGADIRVSLWQLRQLALNTIMTTRLGKIWFYWKNRKNIV